MANIIADKTVIIKNASFEGVYNTETKEFSGMLYGWNSSAGFGSMSEMRNHVENTRTVKIVIPGIIGGLFVLSGFIVLLKTLMNSRIIKRNSKGKNTGLSELADEDILEQENETKSVVVRQRIPVLCGSLALLLCGAFAAGYNNGMEMFHYSTDKIRFNSPWGMIGGFSIFIGAVIFIISLAIYMKHVPNTNNEISKSLKVWSFIWIIITVIAGISVLGSSVSNYYWSYANVSYLGGPSSYVLASVIAVSVMMCVLSGFLLILNGRKKGLFLTIPSAIVGVGIIVTLVTWLMMRKKWSLFK